MSSSIDQPTPDHESRPGDPVWLDLTDQLGVQILGTIDAGDLRWHWVDDRWTPEERASLIAGAEQAMRDVLATYRDDR